MAYGFKSEVAEWNINQVFSEILKDLILEINRSAMEGDYKKWHNNLRILYRNIYGHEKVDMARMVEIDKKFGEAQRRLNKLPNIMVGLSSVQSAMLKKAKSLLDEINLALIQEMYSAGLIFPISKKNPELASLEIK